MFAIYIKFGEDDGGLGVNARDKRDEDEEDSKCLSHR